MPLFICEKCQTIENTALGHYWGEKEKLCSECAFGKWHGRFPKEKFDPKKWEVECGDFIKENSTINN
jgi:hypothetical protein